MRSYRASAAAQKRKKQQTKIANPQTPLLQILLSHTLEWEEHLPG